MVAETRTRVFISYTWESKSHSDWVKQFADDLITRHGVEAFLDQFKVGLGDSFGQFMVSGIQVSHYFLFISTDEARKIANMESPESNKRSLWTELSMAQSRAREKDRDFKEICILRQGDSPPLYFKDKRYIDFREDDKYESQLYELVTELKYGLYKPQLPADPRVVFQVGEVAINQIVAEHLFLRENALTQDHLRSDYENVWTTLPEHLESIKNNAVEQKRVQAIAQGKTLDNNGSYSLYNISITREQDEEGIRQNVYTLHLRPTDFFSFVFPNLAFDEPITINEKETTPRRLLGLEHHKIRLENFHNFRCHFRIGTNTVLITSDNKIVISVRSRHDLVVGGFDRYHISVAEGMLRPVDEQDGDISPFFTSMRALTDELGLKSPEDFSPNDILCLGVLLDTLRAEPLFVFYITTPLTFEDVHRKWELFAKDKHENHMILGLDWNEDTARILNRGRLDYQDRLIEVASNHAQISIMLATLHRFGETPLMRITHNTDDETS